MATTNANAINYFSPAKWVVSKVAGEGTHTTLGGALSAATTGDTIVMMPGSYTENDTISTAVNICGHTGDGFGNVTIIGALTVSSAITVTLANLNLETNSANNLIVSGSTASIVNCINCNFDCTNNTGISFSSSSANSQINLYDCTGNLGTTGIAPYASTSAGALSCFNCFFTNSGLSTTAATNSSGTVSLNQSYFNNAFTSSSTGAISGNGCDLNPGALNVIALTAGGSGTHDWFYTSFVSGTASAISIGSSTTVLASICNIFSSNTNAITGTGTINFTGLHYSSTSFLNNTTTQSGGTVQGLRAGNAPSAGYLGEQIRASASGVSLSNSTAAEITSISLTAGIWDISCVGQCSFGGTTSFFSIGISISSTAVSPNNIADNVIELQTALTSGILALTIPAYRVTLSSTTNYFLVGEAGFTTSTATAAGRISATRVG